MIFTCSQGPRPLLRNALRSKTIERLVPFLPVFARLCPSLHPGNASFLVSAAKAMRGFLDFWKICIKKDISTPVNSFLTHFTAGRSCNAPVCRKHWGVVSVVWSAMTLVGKGGSGNALYHLRTGETRQSYSNMRVSSSFLVLLNHVVVQPEIYEIQESQTTHLLSLTTPLSKSRVHQKLVTDFFRSRFLQTFY